MKWRERGRDRRRELGKETEEKCKGKETEGKRQREEKKDQYMYSGDQRRREKRGYVEKRQWRATELRNKEER
jgi:hypothetical protein